MTGLLALPLPPLLPTRPAGIGQAAARAFVREKARVMLGGTCLLAG